MNFQALTGEIKRLEALVAMARARAAAAGAGKETTEIVFRPGAPSSAPIFATWAEVKAALAVAPTPATIYVDDSIAPAIVPAATGVTDGKGTTTLATYHANFANATVLLIKDGAQLSRFARGRGPLTLACESVTLPGLSWNYVTDSFGLSEAFGIQSQPGAAVPTVNIPGAGRMVFFTELGPSFDQSLSGAQPLIFLGNLGGGASLLFFSFSELTLAGTNVVGGFGGTSIQFVHDDTIARPNFAGYGFLGTVNEVRASLAQWAQPSADSSANRPAGVFVRLGQMDFTTDVGPNGSPTWWNGAQWVGPALLGEDAEASGALPGTTVLPAAGVGAVASTTPNSTTTAGILFLTTGAAPVAGGQVAVDFAAPFALQPKSVVLTPANDAAAGAGQMVATLTTAALTVASRTGGALAAATQYAWNYLILG